MVNRLQAVRRLPNYLFARLPECNLKFRQFTLSCKMHSTSQTPELFAETAGGTDKLISEADLYRYTRQRWLKNEQEELAKRYVKFDLPQLINEAVKTCKGAHHCTRVLKCIEGLHNKAFILTMDNGTQIFAKIPNPNAGPVHYTTASEVATRQMLRDVFSIPVPRVLAWSCNASNNAVQAEYILEEKVPGVRLGTIWYDLPWATRLAIVDQVASFDNTLSSTKFKKHGCIYFREDLQRLSGKAEAIQFNDDQEDATLEQYAMGPLTRAELWKSGREELELDRGPFDSSEAYARALSANETLWIRRNAVSRMNYHRSLKDPELPQDAIDLLAKYEQVASLLVPASSDEAATANVLWHPDFHLDNVFVDPVSHQITGIVDWQSASVAPLFFQSDVHRAFRHYKPVVDGWVVPEKPENFDSLDPAEQRRAKSELDSEKIHKYYQFQTMKRAPRHWEVLARPSVPVLRKPVWLVTGVWENRDLFFLRDSLIELINQWDSVFEEDIACPIAFSPEELELHAKEEENMDGVGKILKLFRDQNILPTDGMVRPEDYETALKNSIQYKEVFLNAAENEEERELYDKIWPY